MGKCPACGEWNTLVETVGFTKKSKSQKTNHKQISNTKSQTINLASNLLLTNNQELRTSSGITEFDRVLGGPSTGSGQGGFVPGQVILLAGEPGIGKSTLLLQVADALAKANSKSQIPNPKQIQNSKSKSQNDWNLELGAWNLQPAVVYVCGEESPSQIKIRASRLGISGDNITLITETDVDELVGTLGSDPRKAYTTTSLGSDPTLLIVDSVQTLTTSDLGAASGSVAQVKECSARILNFVKERGVPTILIGHVNKEGEIAGPKVLEHMVDTVMYLEGERFGSLRLLRCIKNRFGDVGEVGVFQMEDKGFMEVKNPSAAFISERATGAGSVVTVAIEGTRPVLLEVQALASKSSFNYPKRTASGFDLNRVYFICAVIERFLKLPLQGYDVYVNVTAGAKITEPSADLAVAVAIVSSFKNRTVGPKTVVFGEVGLSGEVRSVGSQKRRDVEAKKLGFSNIVSPETVKTLSQAVSLAL